ncbi:MAG TPA: hypothetical protein VF395_19445, partial [Polyangiaceae bacterium]
MLSSSRFAAVALSLLMVSERALAERPVSRPVSSTGEGAASPTEAQRRYEDGVRAYAAGRYREAIDLFRDADQRAPSAALSFDMARAYTRLGDDA